MAVPDAQSAMKLVNDVLELLESPAHCSSFSERGKRQIWQLHQFKEAIQSQRREEGFRLFCQALLGDIRSCIADTSSSVDAKREKSYKMFYERRISVIPKHWDDFHVALGLEGPDPVWTQTVNRLLHISMLQLSRKIPSLCFMMKLDPSRLQVRASLG